LQEDLSNFDPRQMPVNDCGFDIKMKSAGSVENFLYQSLKDGFFYSSSQAHAEWKDCPCEELYCRYRDWCKKESIRIEPSCEFGKKLKKLLLVQKCRRSIEGIREWWYEMPSLQECRAAFEAFTRQTDQIWKE
jgi:hypothetical protein